MKEMGILADIFNKATVTEIIVDRYDDVYWEDGGKTYESDSLFKNEHEIMELIEALLKSVGRDLQSVENGFADIRLGDGTRVTLTLPIISLNGPALVIRKLPSKRVSVADIISWKSIDDEGWKICQKLLETNKNILLAGNAGSGKTTILNLLTESIPQKYRVVTIEQSAEMMTHARKRTLRLETPSGRPNEMKDLIKKAGLLRSDYYVVNELRGSEAFDTINLMREGYEVITTLMAEGVRDALKKLEVLCMMDSLNISPSEIKYHVAAGVEVVIFQERLASGRRVISNISLLQGQDEKGDYICRPLFYFDEESDCFITTNNGKEFLCA